MGRGPRVAAGRVHVQHDSDLYILCVVNSYTPAAYWQLLAVGDKWKWVPVGNSAFCLLSITVLSFYQFLQCDRFHYTIPYSVEEQKGALSILFVFLP